MAVPLRFTKIDAATAALTAQGSFASPWSVRVLPFSLGVETTPQLRHTATRQYYRFVHGMKAGDNVVTCDGSKEDNGRLLLLDRYDQRTCQEMAPSDGKQ